MEWESYVLCVIHIISDDLHFTHSANIISYNQSIFIIMGIVYQHNYFTREWLKSDLKTSRNGRRSKCGRIVFSTLTISLDCSRNNILIHINNESSRFHDVWHPSNGKRVLELASRHLSVILLLESKVFWEMGRRTRRDGERGNNREVLCLWSWAEVALMLTLLTISCSYRRCSWYLWRFFRRCTHCALALHRVSTKRLSGEESQEETVQK